MTQAHHFPLHRPLHATQHTYIPTALQSNKAFDVSYQHDLFHCFRPHHYGDHHCTSPPLSSLPGGTPRTPNTSTPWLRDISSGSTRWVCRCIDDSIPPGRRDPTMPTAMVPQTDTRATWLAKLAQLLTPSRPSSSLCKLASMPCQILRNSTLTSTEMDPSRCSRGCREDNWCATLL